MRYLTLIFILVLILTSCTPAASPTVVVKTAQPSPSPTTRPTATQLHTATVSPSPPPPPTATPTPQPEPPTADIPATLAAAATPVVYDSAPSPDGKWLAEFTRIECTRLGELEEYAFERLVLVSLDDGGRKEVATQLQACGGLGAFGLGSLGWAENSRYFYYTDAREGVPDGLACYWERPMYAYDMTSGEIIALSDGPASPDGNRVAIGQGEELLIWDRGLGEVARIQPAVTGWAVGPRSWSPDGKSLAYLQTEDRCYPYGRSSLVVVNLDDLSQATYLEEQDPPFHGVEWRERDSLLLFTDDGKSWSFNPETGQLTPVEN